MLMKQVIANLAGLVFIALGSYGIEVSSEQQAQIITGLATIGCVINLVLARRKPEGK